MKVKVPVWGTVNKTIFFDPDAGARAEAAVEALAQAISEGVGSAIRHSALQGLQVGDDHPQYTMWQAPETITGQWNFQTVPDIQGETLAEYIEDVVGGGFFDFLQDTPSIQWTYFETDNELEANVDTAWAPVWTARHTYTANSGTQLLTGTTTVNANPVPGEVAHLLDFVNPDGVYQMMRLSSYGGAGVFQNNWHWQRARGTVGAPTVIMSGDFFMSMGLRGYDGTAMSQSAGAFQGLTTENWSNTAHGTKFRFETTPNGSTARIPALDIGPSANTSYVPLSVVGAGTVPLSIEERSAMPSNALNAYVSIANGSFPGGSGINGDLLLAPRSSNTCYVNIAAGSPNPTIKLQVTTGGVRVPQDSTPLTLGVGDDLRLFHDGTDSWVRNDTGLLKLSQGTSVALQFNSSLAFGVAGANYGSTGQVLTSQGSGAPPQWAAAGGGGGALTYVGEAEVTGAAATSITLGGLDLATDECYEVDFIVDNATASLANISLFYNADTTATNYDRRLSQDGGAAAAANDAFALFMVASSTSFYHMTIRPDFDGRPRAIINGNSGNTTNVSGQVGMQMWRTAANVTSITITSSIANAFSIGSKFIVWKRTT